MKKPNRWKDVICNNRKRCYFRRHCG